MEKTCFPKSPALSAAALGSGSTCISSRSSACSLAAGASPAPIFPVTHARSQSGNTAAVQASCTAPFHHAASALQTAFERGSPCAAAAGFPVPLAVPPPLPPHRRLCRWPEAARDPASRNRRLALRRRKSPAVFNQHFPWSCWKPFRSTALFLLIYVELLLGG